MRLWSKHFLHCVVYDERVAVTLAFTPFTEKMWKDFNNGWETGITIEKQVQGFLIFSFSVMRVCKMLEFLFKKLFMNLTRKFGHGSLISAFVVI